MSSLKMQSYAEEYDQAIRHTFDLGINLPSIQLVVRKNCVDLTKVASVLDDLTRNHSVDELHSRSVEFVVRFHQLLLDRLNIPFELTGGWVEHGHRKLFQHGDEYLRPLIEHGLRAGDFVTGLKMHYWITSPSREIIDIFLAGMIARASGIPAGDPRTRGVVYYANDEPDTDVDFIYHPTVIGHEFLEKIGALLPAS